MAPEPANGSLPAPPPLKAVVFDLDGTLADTLPVCFAAFRSVFLHYTGIEYSDREILGMFGPSEEGVIRAQVPDRHEDALEMFYSEYERQHIMVPDMFEGAREVLSDVATRGLRTAIVTGKGSRSAEITLRLTRAAEFFTDVRPGSPHGTRKHEELDALSVLWGMAPMEMAYVGDSPKDVESARLAGWYSVAAAWASTADADELEAEKPDALFRTLPDFHEWLRRAAP